MISLMIVDDEAVIRKGIKTSINWEECGIKITEDAINGKDGLAKALRLKPNIVMTDIRMPLMDGLELAAQLKEKLPATKVIILSGYDDFAYARQALKSGVSEYLLKPVGADELKNAIIRIKNEILKDMKKNEEELAFDLVLNENLQYIQSRFMNSLIRGELAGMKKVLDKAEKLKIALPGPRYQVLIIDIDDFALLTENSKDRDKELIKFSVSNIAGEILQSVFKSIVFYSESDFLIAVVNLSSETDTLLYSTCSEIQFCVKRHLKLTVTISIGRPCSSLEDVSVSFAEAQIALETKTFKGKSKIIPYGEMDAIPVNNPFDYPSEQEKEILNSLKSMDLVELNRALDKMFTDMVNSRIGYRQIKHTCLRCLTISLCFVEERGIDVKEALGEDFDPYEEIVKYETVEDIKLWLHRLYKKLMDYMLESKGDKYRSIIKVAIKYMNEHYHEDIGIKDIASQVYISPNYFSRIFKEETGESFVEWLNKLRIEKAKQYLKDATVKTYEVSEKVGYRDYKYFIYIFKKYTGCTPKEYKESV
ncbi:MAG: response regulator [Clostridia bacterium]|nr:response regulator [Clostridia bacterium]